MHESDEQLYSRLVSEGDKEALDILLERYSGSLTLFLRPYVSCMEDAEDLMMDAFVVIATRKAWSAEGSSFKTWLFAIGRKLALAQIRKRRWFTKSANIEEQELTTEELHAAGEDHPVRQLLRKERNRQLYQALEKLQPEYREVLFLLYFEEMTYEEAGEVMRRNRKQMYHLAERSKAALRSELKRMGFEYESI